jgi:hypothetical protein
MDESGQHISNYEHDVFKVRLDEEGKEITVEKPSGKTITTVYPSNVKLLVSPSVFL